MIKTLKNYWFVILVALVFLGGIVYFISDSMRDVVSGKSVDGKDVVFSINDVNFTADELYEELESEISSNLLVMSFEQAVINQTVELTEEQIVDAKIQAEELRNYYHQSFGDTAEEELDSVMRSIGFNDGSELQKYFEFMTARQQVIDAYLEDHFDEIWPQYVSEYSPRISSHILVTIDDFDNITKEEQDRLDAVEKALADGEDFADVAKEYSQDGSAQNGGSLGFVDKNTTFVEEFLETVLAQKAGEVSDWVKTQYGYHIIKTNATSYEDLKDDTNFQESFFNAYPHVTGNAIWREAQKLEIEVQGNEELMETIKTTLGVKDLKEDEE